MQNGKAGRSDADTLEEYYARRAQEYERIYALPERQVELELLREVVRDFARGRRVLEVACGTGYWTQVAAASAASIVATDAVEEVLAVARSKGLPPARVAFARADAFALDAAPGEFDAAFAGFWWSHVERPALPGFLSQLHQRLRPGARVLFFDNNFVPGSSTPLSREDEAGNTYQRRVLVDGTSYEVVKNFPAGGEIRRHVLDAGGRGVTVETLRYYWHASYEVDGRNW